MNKIQEHKTYELCDKLMDAYRENSRLRDLLYPSGRPEEPVNPNETLNDKIKRLEASLQKVLQENTLFQKRLAGELIITTEGDHAVQ